MHSTHVNSLNLWQLPCRLLFYPAGWEWVLWSCTMDTLLATITARLLWKGNPILESQEIDLDVYWIWVDRICRIICNQLAISKFDPLPWWLLIFGTSTRHRPTRPATTLKTILAWLNSIFHWDCADYNQGDNEPAGLPSPRWKQASKLFDGQSSEALLTHILFYAESHIPVRTRDIVQSSTI